MNVALGTTVVNRIGGCASETHSRANPTSMVNHYAMCSIVVERCDY